MIYKQFRLKTGRFNLCQWEWMRRAAGEGSQFLMMFNNVKGWLICI